MKTYVSGKNRNIMTSAGEDSRAKAVERPWMRVLSVAAFGFASWDQRSATSTTETASEKHDHEGVEGVRSGHGDGAEEGDGGADAVGARRGER